MKKVCNIIFQFTLFCFRNDTVATCLTSMLDDETLLDVYQPIRITWQYAKRKPVVTDFKFMYKANPFVHYIKPAATIMR